MIRKMNNQGQVEIGLLVLMVLGLSLFCLYTFMTNSNKVEAEIIDARFLDEVYMKEDELNFYTELLMRRAVKEFDGSEEDFVEKFKTELENFKIGDEFVRKELLEIKEQINEEIIVIEDDKVAVELAIKIDDKLNDGFLVSYLYEKRFELKWLR